MAQPLFLCKVLYPPTQVLPLQLMLIQLPMLLGGRAATHVELIMTVQWCSVQINLNGREEHEFPLGYLLNLPGKGARCFLLPILPRPIMSAEGIGEAVFPWEGSLGFYPWAAIL